MARDKHHHAARIALEKDGWKVTNNPLELTYKQADFQIDLAAERLIAAERGEEKIAVEVKSFLSKSAISEFHTALGQYLNYQEALSNLQPDRRLYLAVPLDAFETFFQLPFTQDTIKKFSIALIVYNPLTEVIEVWNP
jgi:hypothetical protein